jgi:tetratricopeptide (TPR) repeat protein
MAEEKQAAESGIGSSAMGPDSAAVALALAGASREEADAFLRDQRALIANQCHHLHEQLIHLRLGIWEKRLTVFLWVATAIMGCVLAFGLAALLWNASRADGLVVDAFSVPPQLAEAGITGTVAADDLTNRIRAISDFATNNSLRDSRGVRKDNSDEVKIDIPETGVSLGQAWRYLRLWLGNERHLTGNIRNVGQGDIALSVATDGQEPIAVTGPLSDLDGLEQNAAEQVFARFDPSNIVLYLVAKGRREEGLAAAERNVSLRVDTEERARAFSLWAAMTASLTDDEALALERAKVSVSLYPKLASGHQAMMWSYYFMGDQENALREGMLLRGLRAGDQPAGFRQQSYLQLVREGTFLRDISLGDFAQVAEDGDCVICGPRHAFLVRAEFAARAHDMQTSRALLARAQTEPASRSDARNVTRPYVSRVQYFQHAMAGDWRAATASAATYADQLKNDPLLSSRSKRLRLAMQLSPLMAYAQARAGLADDNVAIIADRPNCYDCVRTLGLIAAAQKNWGQADTLFAKAVGLGPSIPFAYLDWGTSFLDRNLADAAIEKFKLANQKGPHFADPLEGWGEALMAKNQSHLALAKFAEAEKYAPNWGRLHLKWGEALAYAGRKDEAKAQFARAGQLDLTPSEKAELARSHAVATNP